MTKTGIYEVYSLSLSQAKDQLDKAFSEYKEARKEANSWRSEFQDSLMAARAQKHGTTVETEIKKQKQNEKQRRMGRNVRRMLGKTRGGPLMKLYDYDKNGKRVELTTKPEVEKPCIRENERRFGQAEDTPFMQPPLLDKFGYTAATQAGEDVLQGTYRVPDSVDAYTRTFLGFLKLPPNFVPPNDAATIITPEENRKAWSRQSERTASESTGLHFGHYKTAIQDNELCAFDAAMRSIPYHFGFSPKPWQRITDFQILKKLGVWDVSKTRTVQLMMADFNINNKKLGRDMMTAAEDKKTIPREQYGSRHHHRSNIAALNKVLTMDIMRQRRHAGSMCSNDAKSCYDRVVHSIAILSHIRQGAPPSAVKSMFETLQKAVHHVRTAYGVSDRHYAGVSREVPVQGLGQGNGDGPAGWAAISAPLIKMLRAAGFGVAMYTAISDTQLRFACYSFVDDTDLPQTAIDVNTSALDTLPLTQAGVNT
jgi:hypothetical protein